MEARVSATGPPGKSLVTFLASASCISSLLSLWIFSGEFVGLNLAGDKTHFGDLLLPQQSVGMSKNSLEGFPKRGVIFLNCLFIIEFLPKSSPNPSVFIAPGITVLWMLARTILIHILIRATLGSVRAPSILEPTNPYFSNFSSFCLIIERLGEILVSQKYTCLTLHSARLPFQFASHQKLLSGTPSQPAPIPQWHLLSPIIAWGLPHQLQGLPWQSSTEVQGQGISAGFSWTSLLACSARLLCASHCLPSVYHVCVQIFSPLRTQVYWIRVH